MSVEEQMQRCIEEAERQGLVFSKSTTGTYFLEERKETGFFAVASFQSLDYAERCLFGIPWKDRKNERFPKQLQEVMERQSI